MNPEFRSALAAITLVAALFPVALMAQDARNQGYLLDINGNVVTSSTTGVCVRTSDWTPARAAAAAACAQCTPELCPKPAAPPPPAAPKTAPKPEVAPKPAPPKTPAKAPPQTPAKAPPQKINFSADALFDFNKSDLKPQGRAMLDELTRTLQDAQYEVILAIGHTDRIGSAAYNQKLSLRRATAVKQYLVGKGIAPSRVYADGKGKTQPLTKPGDCKIRDSKALIACLQPDRRVEVVVTGTKELK